MKRLGLTVHGIVQGVGFRPYAYREALHRGLNGWVLNEGGRVELEICGEAVQVDAFVAALWAVPPPAQIEQIETRELDPSQAGSTGFSIVHSKQADPEPSLPPDLRLCADCEREILDPNDRRYGHAFASCIACGPRFSISLGLPYDRERTTMGRFPLCPECLAEYRDPLSRRYHAEPIACPNCGPTLSLLSPNGNERTKGKRALLDATKILRNREILALRGVGGFQLLVDARSGPAVVRLRERKRREEKPLAVMFPNLRSIRAVCDLSQEEEQLLTSPAGPIVLLTRRVMGDIAPEVAPGLSELGVFLPSTPLHKLLLDALGFPLVCTSGNPSGEPMCTETSAALSELGNVADAFLVHDRPIARAVDDSVARVGSSGVELLRRARGYAPLPIARFSSSSTILALGAHLKNTVALVKSGRVVMSQHLGDLETRAACDLFERTVRDFLQFFQATPDRVACDLHPDYASSRAAEGLAERLQVPIVRVQHHHAHVAAVMAEHGIEHTVLGLAWDGTGLGLDGTVWGGEALVVSPEGAERIAHLGTFLLPGGDRAAREPVRSALGLLFATDREAASEFAERHWAADAEVMLAALDRRVNTPLTSSMGRLFDAVAALIGVRLRCSYEGQAALELEALAEAQPEADPYPFPLVGRSPSSADLKPFVEALLTDLDSGRSRSLMARRFHETLISFAVEIASRAGEEAVVLAGGCFQNRTLLRGLRRRLSQAGHRVLSASVVPVNDGGLALGQAYVAQYHRG